jgi:Tfp pilus assembly protein PilZ
MTKNEIVDRLLELILQLDEEEKLELLNELESGKRKRERTAVRKPCAIAVYFATDEKIFKSEVRDISKAGVFIKNVGSFCVGQEILMTFSFPGFGESFNFKGTIVRGDHEGIGVKFEDLTPEQEKILDAIVNEA